jgi:hypothetical protein
MVALDMYASLCDAHASRAIQFELRVSGGQAHEDGASARWQEFAP